MSTKQIHKPQAALYIRVSTLQQVDRDSLKTQEERLKAYCKANGIDCYQIYKDAGISAKDTERPALKKILHDIKQGSIHSIFVTKLDRITRSLKDLLSLIDVFEKHHVKFVSITENIDTTHAYGRFMQNLLGLLAQLEREITAERVSVDMKHRAESGHWNGGVIPYGYATQGLLFKKFKSEGLQNSQATQKASKLCPETKRLFVDSDEAETVKLIFNTFLKTNSIRRTTKVLNERGLRTRNGALWSPASIHRVLSNPTYSGKIWYGKRCVDHSNGKLIKQKKDNWTIVEGIHASIISSETFEAVQARLSQNTGKPTKKGRTYLLSGLLKCGLCGGAMSGYSFTKKTGQTYSYYKCSSHMSKGTVACQGQSIPADQFEAAIVDKLLTLSESKPFLNDKQRMMRTLKAKMKKYTPEPDLKRIHQEKSKLQKKLETLLEKMENRLIEDDDFKPRYRSIKNEIKSLEEAEEKIISSNKSNQGLIESLEASFDEIMSFGNNWNFLDAVGKKMRLQAIIKEIRATRETIDMDVYLDVDNVSHMDRDSWPPPA